jgi:hypothetical protein
MLDIQKAKREADRLAEYFNRYAAAAADLAKTFDDLTANVSAMPADLFQVVGPAVAGAANVDRQTVLLLAACRRLTREARRRSTGG